MATLRLPPAPATPGCSDEDPKREEASSTAATARRVREMLLEAAFVLHATRVVGRRGGGVAVKKG